MGLSRHRTRIIAAGAVTLLFGLGFALRWVGIDYQLPELVNFDGLVVVEQTARLRAGGDATGMGSVPLHSYPLFLAWLASLLPAPQAPAGGLQTLNDLIQLANAPWVQARALSCLLALLSIPWTYALARRTLERLPAVFAAGLVTTSILHITLAIQEKPHAAAASLDLLALLAALRMARKPTLGSYVAAGLAAGAAVAMLHSAAICIPALLMAYWLRERGLRWASPLWFGLSLALVGIAVVLSYPFFFGESWNNDEYPEPGPSLGDFSSFLLRMSDGSQTVKMLGSFFMHEPVLFTLGVSGLLFGALRVVRSRSWRPSQHREAWIVGAFVVPYLVVLLFYSQTLLRFYLPFVPLLAWSAGDLFQRAVQRSHGYRATPGLRVAAVALLLALTAWPATHLAWIRTQPSPLEQAARWVEEHVDPKEVVVVVPYCDLPLLYNPLAAHANRSHSFRSPWSDFQRTHPIQHAELKRHTILVEPGKRPESRMQFQRDPMGYARQFKASYLVFGLAGAPAGLLEGRAECVARFTPGIDDPDARGLSFAGKGTDRLAPTVHRILSMRTFGTGVEIYRVP